MILSTATASSAAVLAGSRPTAATGARALVERHQPVIAGRLAQESGRQHQSSAPGCGSDRPGSRGSRSSRRRPAARSAGPAAPRPPRVTQKFTNGGRVTRPSLKASVTCVGRHRHDAQALDCRHAASALTGSSSEGCVDDYVIRAQARRAQIHRRAGGHHAGRRARPVPPPGSGGCPRRQRQLPARRRRRVSRRSTASRSEDRSRPAPRSGIR